MTSCLFVPESQLILGRTGVSHWNGPWARWAEPLVPRHPDHEWWDVEGLMGRSGARRAGQRGAGRNRPRLGVG